MRFHVSTTSMLPTLQPGDGLVVEGATATDVKTGDLVIIRNEHTWVAHRLIQRNASPGCLRWLTKGDHRLLADTCFDGTALVGVVKIIQRGERSIRLDIWQVERGGCALAWLSGWQAALGASKAGPTRRLLIKILQWGVSLLASLVYKI